jgi:hypothetical protein
MQNDFWLRYPDDFEMCETCTGTGTVRCSSCVGTGSRRETRYDRDYEGRPVARDEWVSCPGCAGTGDKPCSPCSGTGSVQKHSRTRSGSRNYAGPEPALIPSPTVEPDTGTPSPGQLNRKRDWILDYRLGQPELPVPLATDWHRRLSQLTDANCLAEVEAILREVIRARKKSFDDANLFDVSKTMDQDRQFSHLEADLRELRDMLARYWSARRS